MTHPRALVIGGSVGGLFAAHLLRRAGWDAAVFERASGDLGDRGTGIGTREELFAIMRRIGLPADAAIGVQVRGRVALGRDGTVVHERQVPAVTSAWSNVWRPLRQALPDACYVDGKALARVEPCAGGATAVFADGLRAEAELVIAADGLHSSVRAQLIPDLKPRYAGYVAWRGVIDEHQVAPSRRELLFQQMVFGFPEGELMLSIPMPGPQAGAHAGAQAGERRCHFVWFRPVPEAALVDLCTDASGRRHGASIPPPLIRPELIAKIRGDAHALLAPQLAALVSGTAQVILQPIFDLESPRIVFDRVVLLGDAAFVARPHVASGVMKAALDAQCLGDALAGGGDIAAGLALYERERRRFGSWLVGRGRHIGGYFEARLGDPRQRIETVMREYGAAGLVDDRPITAHGAG